MVIFAGCRAVALIATLVALLGCGGEAAPLFIDVVRDYGATADGATDDEPAIQGALDLAATSGGGTVHLPAGVYGISRPLVLRSNVTLQGVGRGKSILRSTVKSLGKYVDATGVWAAVAAVSADRASVRDLTVDLSFAKTHANGVAILPDGSSFEGTVSTNCTVERIEVIGGGDYHAYMIWNLRGKGIRIIDNVVDGRVETSTAFSSQEGIESYGGTDVVVRGNIVRNIGGTGLNFGSAGLPDTGIERLKVVGNVVTNAGRGLNIGPWMDFSGPQNVDGVQIVNNEFIDLWRTGVYVSVQPGTRIRDMRISGNTIANVGEPNSIGAAGIHVQGARPTASLPAGAAVDTFISENVIDGVRGTNAIGLLSIYYPNLTFAGNKVSNVDTVGVQTIAPENLVVRENVFVRIQQIGLLSREAGSVYVRDNFFENWVRISAIVDACFTLIVDGETAPSVTRWGSAQVLG